MHACSIVSDFFVTPWTVPTRLLCPWDSSGKNTGVGCHALVQGIFPRSLAFYCSPGGFFTTSTTWESPVLRLSTRRYRLCPKSWPYSNGWALGRFLLGLRGRFFCFLRQKTYGLVHFPQKECILISLLWDLKSLTRDRNQQPPAVEGSSLNHWTAKEFPYFKSFKLR